MAARRSSHAPLLDAAPAIAPPLDPAFRPAVLATRRYREARAAAPAAARLVIGLERTGGAATRFEMEVLPPGSPHDADTLRLAERTVKFLLWSRGGWRLRLAGPQEICGPIAAAYAPGGGRAFDAELMGRAFGRRFEAVVEDDPARIPAGREPASRLGGHLEGCRIGFDLGASDFKLAAVRDGAALFSTEIPWDPVAAADPAYHIGRLSAGLEEAASRLPRVDAIGGSAAGIYVDNQVMVASLFRSVPAPLFEQRVRGMFLRLAEEWRVPLVVMNDGEVTALAGGLSLGESGLLGIAMGSSEAAGYLDPEGRLTTWIDELAFAPVDFAPGAPADEWSGDRGVGANYFSQQAVARLAPAAGIAFDQSVPFPERLKEVQRLAEAGHAGAVRIFETIGVYLGYTIPHYADFYDLKGVLMLGRVTSGRGGEVIRGRALAVLAAEFPDVAARVALHVPDEKSRRVGQAVAAASLPELVERKQ